MKLLIESFDNKPIYKTKDGGTYIVNTITDHIPSTHPQIITEAMKALNERIGNRLLEADKIVGEEERGGYLAACFSLYTNRLPFCLAKQNPCDIPGEIGVEFEMAYNTKMKMYFNGLNEGDKVIIIDDIIDTGGTMIAMINTLRKINVRIIGVIAIAERVEKKGIQRIKEMTGITAESIIQLDTSEETSKVINKADLLNTKASL